MNRAVPPRWLPLAVVASIVIGVLLALWTFGAVTIG